MSRPSVAKAAKRKARSRRVERRPTVGPQGGKYPRVEIDPGNAPEGLVELLREAKVSLGSVGVFTAWEREYFRLIKARGVYGGKHEFMRLWEAGGRGPETWRELEHLQAQHTTGAPLDKRPSADFVRDCLTVVPGHRLFERIPVAELRRYLPLHCVKVKQVDDGREVVVRVSFDHLRRVKTSGGSCYHTELAPAVEIDGRQYRVAYMHHAAQRICERFVPPWLTYIGHRFAYSLISGDDASYTTATLGNGERALVLWLRTRGSPGTVVWHYGREVVGREPGDAERDFKIRAGYFPFFLHEGFVVAKTLVLPWFQQSPEMEFIRTRAMIDDGLRRQLSTTARWATDNEHLGLKHEADVFKLLRRFQGFGFTQAERVPGGE